MQTKSSILNVHQAASNGDPREVRIEYLHFILTHPNIFFNAHILF